jgi:hypothetical protein
VDENSPEVGAAFTRAIHEIRVSIPDTEVPPFDIHVTMLIRSDELSVEEADALYAVGQAIRQAVDPALVRIAEVRALAQEEMSLAEYFATRPLFLEYWTYQGQEPASAPPLPRG